MPVGSYALDWSATSVGKSIVYSDGMFIDYTDKPTGAAAAVRFRPFQGANNISQGFTLALTLASAGAVSFYRKVSSDLSDDGLRFFVDGAEQAFYSGEVVWGQVSFALTAGAHTMEWRYTKGNVVTAGSDTAWVALLTVTNVQDPPAVTESAAPPVVYGFDDDVTPPGMTGGWTVSTTTPITGTKSLRSPSVANSTNDAALTLTLPENGVVKFKWKRSSDYSDFFEFKVGSTLVVPPHAGAAPTEATGEMWAVVPGGSAKTLTWSYRKDGNFTAGSDSVFIDDLSLPYQGVAPASSPTSSLAATMQARVAAFVSDAVLASSLAATTQPRVAAFASTAVSAESTSSLAATMQPRVAAFSSSVAIDASVRASTLAGALQPKAATFAANALVPVTPAPALVLGERAVVRAKAFGAVTISGTQAIYTVAEAWAKRARQQIIVGGVDVTYFRGVTTPDVSYTLLEPLLYGPASVEFPQIVACFETEGAGALSWLRAQAPVQVNRVVDDVVVGTDWKGFVAAFDKSGRTLSVELGGEANGRAAMRDRQVPVFPRFNDLGHQMADAIRDLGLPHYPNLGAVTGIETLTTGGTGHLNHINDLHAKAWTRSGRQWSTMPNEATGVYETHRKDGTTIHGTVFLDDAKTVGTLRRDIAEEPNQIFVTCVTPAGMRVRFAKYPNLTQGPVPAFPGNMSFGDTGEGVRLLTMKLHASGYIRLAEVAGGFDDDVLQAVYDLQTDAGLPYTGVVNLATWEALYDLSITGLTLEGPGILPAASRSKTRKYDRSANGTPLGFNVDYDPAVIVRHRTIDMGSGVSRKQAREFAKTVLHDSDAANWVGDIVFHTGALVRGTGTIGMSVTAASVMDARELRPGMNLWLPQFDGGTLVHISACQVNDGLVTATVDTRFRDALEVWEVISRNAESRNDPSRHRNRKQRASTIPKDSIGEWDEFGGMLGVDLNLVAGWNEFPVIGALAGQINRFRISLTAPAEFAVAVTGAKVGVNRWNDLIGAPLTIVGTKDWERAAVDSVLQNNFICYSAGTKDEPCGYGRGRKADGDPLTGTFNDRAGFPYFSADRTQLWVAVWVGAANKIEAQRIMWPQLEAGV